MNRSWAPRLPDFYIVGAPKCGTSALFAYLAAHANIAMSKIKEPSHWSTDVNPRQPRLSRDQYLELWTGASAEALRGEASTAYIRSKAAIPAILAESPDARFILMLRNPAEMAKAWHSQLIYSFHENVGNFERAWQLQATRLEGRRIPPECDDPECLQYRRVCALGEQLQRFVGLVRPEQRLIIFFDDFAVDTRREYLKVLTFLGLTDDGRQDFPKINANRNRRSPRLGELHRRLGRMLGPFYGPLRAIARLLGVSPSELIDRFTANDGARQPTNPIFESLLCASFLPEVETIEAITGRDLKHWKLPKEHSPSKNGADSALSSRLDEIVR